jgi:hypothetical protein
MIAMMLYAATCISAGGEDDQSLRGYSRKPTTASAVAGNALTLGWRTSPIGRLPGWRFVEFGKARSGLDVFGRQAGQGFGGLGRLSGRLCEIIWGIFRIEKLNYRWLNLSTLVG